MKGPLIRPIRATDNQAMAGIIRNSLEEFHADRAGTVYFDDSTDHLFELFRSVPRSRYYIAAQDGEVMGGAGIFPTENLPAGTCELVKWYLSRPYRGLGVGGKLITACFEAAKNLGYDAVYLETMPELSKAVVIYEKLGFKYLNAPLGNSGHSGCGIWMLKALV